MAYRKMYMIPAEDPKLVEYHKERLTQDPLLDTAAKLSARKTKILRDPRMSASRKKSLVKQLNPRIQSLIKRMRQLPGSSASRLLEEGEDEEEQEDEDLVSPVQTKLLRRILKSVTPSKSKGTRVSPTVGETPRAGTAKPRVPRRLEPVMEEKPPPTPEQLEAAVERGLRRTKTPQVLRRSKRFKKPTDWEPW